MSGFMGIFATEDRDEELKTNWGIYGSLGLSCGGLLREGCEAYLVTLTDICSFLCFSGQRGTIALYLSLCMRSICVS